MVRLGATEAYHCGELLVYIRPRDPSDADAAPISHEQAVIVIILLD
jgi:hypothetical protein